MLAGVLRRLALVWLGFALVAVLFATAEGVLWLVRGGETRLHDPFVGFAELVPMFEPERDDPGRAVYRTAVARRKRNRDEFLAVKPENGLRVFVGVAQNLSDWSPGGSLHDPDLDDAALARFEAHVEAGDAAEPNECAQAERAWREALALDTGVAELHFRLAHCARRCGDLALAREHFQLASDLDAIPHGAPSSRTALLREIAADRDVDELRAARPDMRLEEHLLRAMSCALVQRVECVEAETAAALEIDPTDERVQSTLDVMKMVRAFAEERG